MGITPGSIYKHLWIYRDAGIGSISHLRMEWVSQRIKVSLLEGTGVNWEISVSRYKISADVRADGASGHVLGYCSWKRPREWGLCYGIQVPRYLPMYLQNYM